MKTLILTLTGLLISAGQQQQANDPNLPKKIPSGVKLDWSGWKATVFRNPRLNDELLDGKLKVVACDLDKAAGKCVITVENISKDAVPGIAFVRFYDAHHFAVIKGLDQYWALNLSPDAVCEMSIDIPAPWVQSFALELRQRKK